MENYVTAQLAALCKAVLLGWLSGCVYDLLRSVRLLRRRSRALTHTLDALYGAALLLALLGFALHVGGGQLRLYMLLGAAAGCALYFWAFRGIFRPLWGFWTGAAASMAALLARPARFALKTAKKIGRFRHLSRVNAQKSKNNFQEARMRAISSRKSCSEHR